MKKTGLCVMVGLCVVLGSPLSAQAAGGLPCISSVDTINTSLNPGYMSCIDAKVGDFSKLVLDDNSSVSALELLEQSYGFPWRLLGGYSTDPGFGPFASDPTGLMQGTLLLDQLRRDMFVIALQGIGVRGGEESVFYRFDYSGTAGTAAVRFDTLGLDDIPGSPLRVATLYVPAGSVPPSEVPEPATCVLALAGLGVLAMSGRRRRTQSA